MGHLLQFFTSLTVKISCPLVSFWICDSLSHCWQVFNADSQYLFVIIDLRYWQLKLWVLRVYWFVRFIGVGLIFCYCWLSFWTFYYKMNACMHVNISYLSIQSRLVKSVLFCQFYQPLFFLFLSLEFRAVLIDAFDVVSSLILMINFSEVHIIDHIFSTCF